MSKTQGGRGKLQMEPSQETDQGAAPQPRGRPRGRPRKRHVPAPEGQSNISQPVATGAGATMPETSCGDAASGSPRRTRSGSRLALPASVAEAPPGKRRRKTRQTGGASGSRQAEATSQTSSAVVGSIPSPGELPLSHSSEMAPEAAGGSHPEMEVAPTYPLTDAAASVLAPSDSTSGQPAGRGEVAPREGGSEGPRVKRPDFTPSENMTLVQGIIENWNCLYGPGARRMGSEGKQRIWSTVASRVSALGVCLRDARACKKRYGDIRTRIKLKVIRQAAMRQGVAGRRSRPPQFTDYEELLRPYIPAVTVEGVSSFGDTSLMRRELTSAAETSARETSNILHTAEVARPTVGDHGTQHPGPGQASRGEVEVPSAGEVTSISGAESVAQESEDVQHVSPPSPVVAHSQTSGGGAHITPSSGDEGSYVTTPSIASWPDPSSPAPRTSEEEERHMSPQLPLRQHQETPLATDPHTQAPTSQMIGQQLAQVCERIRQRLDNPPLLTSPEFQPIAQLIQQLVALIPSITGTLSSQQEGILRLLERIEANMQQMHRERQGDLEASIRASVDACMTVACHRWQQQYQQFCAALIDHNAGTVNRFATVVSSLERVLGAQLDVLQQMRAHFGQFISWLGRWSSQFPGGLPHPPPEPQHFPDPYYPPYPHTYPPSAPPPSYPMWPEPQPHPSQPPTSDPSTSTSSFPHPPPQPPPGPPF